MFMHFDESVLDFALKWCIKVGGSLMDCWGLLWSFVTSTNGDDFLTFNDNFIQKEGVFRSINSTHYIILESILSFMRLILFI